MQCIDWCDIVDIYADILIHNFSIKIENDILVVYSKRGTRWSLKEYEWICGKEYRLK